MNVLETLQKIAATTERLDTALAEIERERAERQRFEQAVSARAERTDAAIADIRERLARLEAARDADRAQVTAELARFAVHTERTEIRLATLLSGQRPPPALPGDVGEP